MNEIKKTTLRDRLKVAWGAFQGKPKTSISLGVEVKQCKECRSMPPRICEVGGQIAFFHRWVVEEEYTLKLNSYIPMREMEAIRTRFDRWHIAPAHCDLEKNSTTLALVELADGSVKKVAPEKVRFCDREEAER